MKPGPAPAVEPTVLEARERVAAPSGWRQRFLAWRDRLLVDPAFRRRAVRSWWMRPIARRRARGLFDLVAGFVYSQVLLACVRIRLFDALADGPRTAADLARQAPLPLDGMQRLLAAAVSLKLVEHRAGARYGLGPLGAPMVGNGALQAMVEHHAVLYADLADPLALLRGGGAPAGLSQYWAYATAAEPGALAPAEVDAYSALMSTSQPLVAEEVLDSYDLRRHRCLLDVGGGQGRFLRAAALRAPHLRVMLFDLPGVVPAAQAAFAADGLQGRSSVHGGDFTRDPLPTGADIASLVRVLYDHPDDRAAAIVQAVYQALPAGGTLLVAEPLAGAAGAERVGDAYFGFYLLAMQGGRPRTAADITALLLGAGFESVREVRTPLPLQVGLLVARKPAEIAPSAKPASKA